MSQPAPEIGEDATGRPIGWWTRWWLRADPLPLLLIALASMLACFWRYHSPVVAMVAYKYYEDFLFGLYLFCGIAAGRRIQLAVRNAYEARFGVPSSDYRSQRFFWPWLLALVAITFVTVRFEFPMYASFKLSRAALDSLADEALRAPENAHLLAGRRAGLYRIDRVEIIGNTVLLYVNTFKRTGFGFARVPSARDDVIFNHQGLEHLSHFCADFPPESNRQDPEGERITGDWFVVYSGYWRTKFGWS
jgi:hypothetical protein